MALTKPRAYQIYDIDYKQATRVITVSNITLSGGAPSQVDGVSLSLNDRVLVTGQTNKAQNGIYFVTTVGSGSNGTWTRSIDTDATGELLAGTIVMVTEGLIYADTQWKLTTDNPIIIGVSELIFEQNSAFAFGNVYANGTAVLASSVGDVLTLTAGDNISISGNNTTKTVTIGVTGISLNSISNGTSNVNVVSSGGNVTVGVAGTSNVAVFSNSGQNVTGYLTATGNVTGGNIISASLGSAGNTAIIGINNALTSTDSLFVDVANNRIGVGTVTPERTFDLVGNAAFTGDVQITQYNNSSDSGGIRVRKSRGADNAPDAVLDGDTVGSVEFFLRDTSGFQQRASITSVAQVSGSTYGADFAIGTGNGASPTTRLYIAEGGAITFNQAYTFPTADGSANAVLVTNGSGALSFTETPTFSSITSTGNITGGNLISSALISGTTITASGNLVGGNANVTNAVNAATISTSGNATIGGNLIVQGNITYINIDDLQIEDPVIVLGTGPNGAPLTVNDNKDRGIFMEYYTTGIGNAFVGWDNSSGNMIIASDVGLTNDVVSVETYGTLQAGNLYVQSVLSTGNITGGNVTTSGIFSGAGTGLTGTASSLTVGAATTAGTVTTAAQPNITSVGTLSSLTVTANVVGGNLTTAGQVAATGNITGGNLKTASVTIGNGPISGLTTISASGNANVGNLGAVTVVATTLTGTLSTASQPNITSVGTLGSLSVTGNITGGNILGNGAGLSGINTFSNVTVTGGNSAVADSISDTLTLTAGDGIAISIDSSTDTITIAASGGSEIFVDGADFGTVDEAVTASDDLGLVTEAVEAESDLGSIVTAGLIYPDQFVLPSYTVTTLPSASISGAMIYVTNESGGAVPAFSDGTNWRRVTDRAIVS